VAQLVEHNLAKVGVAGSNPVVRSRSEALFGASVPRPGASIARPSLPPAMQRAVAFICALVPGTGWVPKGRSWLVLSYSDRTSAMSRSWSSEMCRPGRAGRVSAFPGQFMSSLEETSAAVNQSIACVAEVT
jgi:hypothetical protein